MKKLFVVTVDGEETSVPVMAFSRLATAKSFADKCGRHMSKQPLLNTDDGEYRRWLKAHPAGEHGEFARGFVVHEVDLTIG